MNPRLTGDDLYNRVRTLTGKEIELDIEPDYKVCPSHAIEEVYLPTHLRNAWKTAKSEQKREWFSGECKKRRTANMQQHRAKSFHANDIKMMMNADKTMCCGK